jgi:hypothetical protein
MLQGNQDASMIFSENNSENVTVNAIEEQKHPLPNKILR